MDPSETFSGSFQGSSCDHSRDPPGIISVENANDPDHKIQWIQGSFRGSFGTQKPKSRPWRVVAAAKWAVGWNGQWACPSRRGL